MGQRHLPAKWTNLCCVNGLRALVRVTEYDIVGQGCLVSIIGGIFGHFGMEQPEDDRRKAAELGITTIA